MYNENLSGERLDFLIRISTTKFKNPIAIQELIKLIKIKRANFTFIKQILLKNSLATEQQLPYGNAKALNINIKKLDEFITDSKFYNMIANYVKTKKPFTWTP